MRHREGKTSMEERAAFELFTAFIEKTGQPLINLLLDVERLYLRLASEELERVGVADLSNLELRTVAQLCITGIRSSQLPRRLNMSKQAVSQVLAGLEKKGLIVRRPDPEDKRGKTISFTRLGFERVAASLGAAMTVEKRLEQKLGAEVFAALKATLAKLTRRDPAAGDEA